MAVDVPCWSLLNFSHRSPARCSKGCSMPRTTRSPQTAQETVEKVSEVVKAAAASGVKRGFFWLATKTWICLRWCSILPLYKPLFWGALSSLSKPKKIWWGGRLWKIYRQSKTSQPVLQLLFLCFSRSFHCRFWVMVEIFWFGKVAWLAGQYYPKKREIYDSTGFDHILSLTLSWNSLKPNCQNDKSFPPVPYLSSTWPGIFFPFFSSKFQMCWWSHVISCHFLHAELPNLKGIWGSPGMTEDQQAQVAATAVVAASPEPWY